MRKILIFSVIILLWGCGSEEAGWVDLFNGENLEGWHTYNAGKTYDGWYVDNGVLVFDPAARKEARNSNLMTDRQYTSFELELDWMISEHGNSGIFWGVVEDESIEHPYQTGAEIQILDDNWTEYIEERGDINRAGSLYNLMPPAEVVSKPAGEWNTYLLHIDHNENTGYLVFNGTEVLRFPVHGPEWQEMIANSAFSDWEQFGTARTGHICLQDNGSKVAFRNIRIREL